MPLYNPDEKIRSDAKNDTILESLIQTLIEDFCQYSDGLQNGNLFIPEISFQIIFCATCLECKSKFK